MTHDLFNQAKLRSCQIDMLACILIEEEMQLVLTFSILMLIMTAGWSPALPMGH